MKKAPTTKNQVHPYRDALAHLKKADPVLYTHAKRHVEAITATYKHRRNYQDAFEALAGSIVSQQLASKAADTIWKRLEVACTGTVSPEAITKLRLPAMRKAGLSGNKAKALKELSKAVKAGRIDFKKLKAMPEEEAIATLSGVWGIGRWTAEMFLMFALARPDVFSPGDLGLIRSMEELYGIKKDSKRDVYAAYALRWSPHRTFASRVLWRIRDVPTANALGA